MVRPTINSNQAFLSIHMYYGCRQTRDRGVNLDPHIYSCHSLRSWVHSHSINPPVQRHFSGQGQPIIISAGLPKQSLIHWTTTSNEWPSSENYIPKWSQFLSPSDSPHKLISQFANDLSGRFPTLAEPFHSILPDVSCSRKRTRRGLYRPKAHSSHCILRRQSYSPFRQ